MALTVHPIKPFYTLPGIGLGLPSWDVNSAHSSAHDVGTSHHPEIEIISPMSQERIKASGNESIQIMDDNHQNKTPLC